VGMLNKEFLQLVMDKSWKDDLLLGEFALEKENTRVDQNGKLAVTPHPTTFGSKMENIFIKTDFSESQIEMITPIFNTIDETYQFLETLHDIVTLELKDEYLWPSSNPPELPIEEQIPLANMNDPIEDQYRFDLANKYGRKRQLLSGIHYNFSFNEEFLKKWHKEVDLKGSFKDFKDAIYLRVARNTLKYRWLLIYLTGASPVFHKTYIEECVEQADQLDENSFFFQTMNSLRNSEFGYRNEQSIHVSFDSIEDYVKDLQSFIQKKELLDVRELYSLVRLKTTGGKDYLQDLLDSGISYLELRMIDLNPLTKNGISRETMQFIHLFLIYILVKQDEPFDVEEQRVADLNHDLLTNNGIMERLYVHDDNRPVLMQEKGLEMIEDMQEMIRILKPNDQRFENVLKLEKQKLVNDKLSFANQIIAEIQKSSYLPYHLNKAKQYADESTNSGYHFFGYEDLELSTQLLLKAALKRGIEFEIIDRDENFIVLKKGDQKEYVKQATKTSLDSYMTVLIMENKLVTKEVLKKKGIRVPKGKAYRDLGEAMNDFELSQGKPVVIKPKSTNFGLGITIFTSSFSKEDYQKAFEMAFEHDKTVLLEEFLTGKEYRFLVMGDEVVGILHRVPANVIGDGVHTIEQLVHDKNSNPLRGEGYKTPLERIRLGEVEKMFLKNQSKSMKDILEKGEIVYLRENSNISTGGDSIDYTDEIPYSYKRIAIQSAKAAGAMFCGVDMMIDNIEDEASLTNFGIIEINFNPAIHIHCYPYKGKNRKADEKILDLLFGK